MNHRPSNDNDPEDSSTFSERLAELAKALHLLADDVRVRTSGADRPAPAERRSGVRLRRPADGTAAASDFATPEGLAPEASFEEARRVLDEIETETASGRGPSADLQRAIG